MLLVGAIEPAMADQLGLVGGARLEFHDNAALRSTDEKSDVERVVSADISYKRPDGPVQINLDYKAEYRDYLHGEQGDGKVIDGTSSLLWQIQPRLLDLVLNHQISQQLTDARTADVSDNREERSVITAGLNGYLHLSGVDSLMLSPRFTDVRYEDTSGSNSQRSSMAAMWQRRLSPVSRLELTGAYDHATFDQSANDYDSPSLTLAYFATLSRLSYQLQAGYRKLDRDQGNNFNGTTARVAFDYRGDGYDWGGTYVRELTDTSIGLASAQLDLTNFTSRDSNFTQFDVVERDQIDGFFQWDFGTSTRLRFGAGGWREDYKDTLQDEKGFYGQVSLNYTINSYWSTGIQTSYRRTEFLDDINDLHYNDKEVRLTASYRPLRPLEIQFSLAQEKRDANVSTSSYTDNIALVGVNYRFF